MPARPCSSGLQHARWTLWQLSCLHVLLCCPQEVERGDDDIVEVDMHNSCVLVNEMKLKVDLTKYAERHQFNFDESLDEYVSNDQVRRHMSSPL